MLIRKAGRKVRWTVTMLTATAVPTARIKTQLRSMVQDTAIVARTQGRRRLIIHVALDCMCIRTLRYPLRKQYQADGLYRNVSLSCESA